MRLRSLLLPALAVTLLATPAGAASTPFLTPAQLRQAMRHKTFVLVNVHVPNEGAIPGTDLTLPYDTVASSAALPANRAADIVLYCRSGHMSAIARRTLQGLGYTHVRELQGGFNAWAAAGYPLNR